MWSRIQNDVSKDKTNNYFEWIIWGFYRKSLQFRWNWSAGWKFWVRFHPINIVFSSLSVPDAIRVLGALMNFFHGYWRIHGSVARQNRGHFYCIISLDNQNKRTRKVNLAWRYSQLKRNVSNKSKYWWKSNASKI